MTLETDLDNARNDFFIVCITLNYQKEVVEKALNNYIKSSDAYWKPKIDNINVIERRLKKCMKK